MQDFFSKIYKNNDWGNPESVSGLGASLSETIVVRRELPRIIAMFDIKTMLDIPCGDFHWMKEVELNLEKYIGADIVPDLIARNNRIYAKDNKAFVVLDIIRSQLPCVDIIICRDCLVHLSFEDIKETIANMKASKSKYLLTTTFVNKHINEQISTGEWRTINLQLPSFHFPPPMEIINEELTIYGSEYSDKSLGLWEINKL